MGSTNAGVAKHKLGYGLLAVTAAGLLLSGCGGGSGGGVGSGSGSAASVPGPAVGAGAGVASSGVEAGAPTSTVDNAPAFSTGTQSKVLGSVSGPVLPALQDRSVIRVATIEVRVKNVLDAAGQVEGLATSAGGYVGGEQTQADPDHPELSRAVVTLRVPATALPQLLIDVARLGGLLAQDQSATDVTGQVIDVQARLASQQASVDRIRALLGQAKTLGQVIQIEGELANREGALESLQGQAKDLADQTALATVTATLVGPQAAAPVKPAQQKGFSHGLSRGWDAFTSATNWLLAAVGTILPFLLIAVPLGWVAWVLRRRRTTGVVVSPPPGLPVEVA